MNTWVSKYAPHIVVGLILGTIVAASYGALAYAPSGGSASKVNWSINSVNIQFSATAGSSAPVPDSFKCVPSATGSVNLVASTSNPSKVILSVLPTSFPSCSSNASSSNPIHLIAQCIVPASQCVGTYTGTVTVRQGYQTLVPTKPLSVTIVVTS